MRRFTDNEYLLLGIIEKFLELYDSEEGWEEGMPDLYEQGLVMSRCMWF